MTLTTAANSDTKNRWMIANARNTRSPSTPMLRRLAYILMLDYEKRTQGRAATLAANVPASVWDDYTNSNPMTDVDAGREVIHNNTGLDPNLLVISRPVFFKLKEHPKILDKIKYT